MNPDVGKGGAHHLCDGTFLRGIGARLLPRQDHVRQGPDHVHGGLHPGLAHAPLQTSAASADVSKLTSPHRRRQAFDPTFAAMHLTPAMVDDLMAIEPLAAHDLLNGLKQELPGLPVGRRHVPGAQRTDEGATKLAMGRSELEHRAPC